MQISVGITGHRRLEQADQGLLQKQIGEVLQNVRKAVTESAGQGTEIILRLISPLAEGADRIAAEAGLELGYQLHSPLPFPVAEYVKDFRGDPVSEQHFRCLLARATPYELKGSRRRQGQAYLAVGRKVLAMSDVLIAVWDGEAARGQGGTGQIVAEALAQGMLVIWVSPQDSDQTASHQTRALFPDNHTEDWQEELRQRILQLTAIYHAPDRGVRWKLKPALARTEVRRSIPLVIGVAGPEQIGEADQRKLGRAVAEILERLVGQYPATPVLLLSTLMTRGERMVAEQALQIPNCYLGIITPSGHLGPEARNLRRRARKAKRLMVHAFMPEAAEAAARPAEAAEIQLALTHAYIARHSEMLLALWDGCPGPDAWTGPAAMVRYQLEGIPAQILTTGCDPGGVRAWFTRSPGPLTPVDSGLVFHVVTRRTGDRGPGKEVGTLRYPPYTDRRKVKTALRGLHDVIRQVNRFNQAVQALGQELDEQVPASGRQFIARSPDPDRPVLPVETDLLLERYAVADSLAMRFQTRTTRTLYSLLTILPAAAFFYNFHGSTRWWSLVIYLLALAAAGVVWYQGHRGEVKSRHLDYRALAEGMRIQVAWRLAGISDDVAEHYLYKQVSELAWIRAAIRAWSLPYRSAQVPASVPLSRVPEHDTAVAVNHWVRAQARYYQKAIRRDQDRLTVQNRRVKALFGLGLLMAFLLLVSYWVVPSEQYALVLGLAAALTAEMPVIAAAIDTYGEKMALADQQRQYQRMAPVFDLAVERIQQALWAKRHEEAQQLLTALGDDALSENGDWVNLHRDRTLPTPRV